MAVQVLLAYMGCGHHLMHANSKTMFVQMEEYATKEFDNICRSDNIPIDMTVLGEPLKIQEYIESWHMKLWDRAYTGAFKEVNPFKKSNSFKDACGAMLAVK